MNLSVSQKIILVLCRVLLSIAARLRIPVLLVVGFEEHIAIQSNLSDRDNQLSLLRHAVSCLKRPSEKVGV